MADPNKLEIYEFEDNTVSITHKNPENDKQYNQSILLTKEETFEIIKKLSYKEEILTTLEALVNKEKTEQYEKLKPE